MALFNLKNSGLSVTSGPMALTAGILVVVAAMVFPIPLVVLDVLQAASLAAAVLVLTMALAVKSPLDLASFPAILLMVTLFRLSLSIAATRAILVNGEAGHIIETFGQFVAGGNLVAGMVVFLVITITQFIVITKGSERVAEVAARFSLDAMPGKQMSIDGDLRSGTIDMEEARRRRSRVEKQSQVYGALDGAMKFIKGDSIAGLLAIAVNLIGGLTIGVTQRGMSMGEASHVYSILTIGDGMITQIPSLLSAVAAGLIVTRVDDSEENKPLASALASEARRLPGAFVASAVALALLAFIPGFPSLAFIGLAALFAVVARIAFKSVNEAEEKANTAPTQEEQGSEKPVPLTPLLVTVSQDFPGGAPGIQRLRELLRRARRRLIYDMGVNIPPIACRINPSLPAGNFALLIDEVPRLEARFDPSALHLCDDDPDILQNFSLEALPETPLKITSHLAKPSDRGALLQAGAHPLDAAEYVAYMADGFLTRHISDFLSLQDVKQLLSTVERSHPDLYREALRIVPLARAAEIIRRLVQENVPVRDLKTIMGALIEWGPREKDSMMLAENVRTELGWQICHAAGAHQGVLSAVMIVPEWEDTLRSAVRQTSAGSFLVLSPDESKAFLQSVRKAVGPRKHGVQRYPLLTTLDTRRHARRLIENEFPDIMVLSYQEIPQDLSVWPVKKVERPEFYEEDEDEEQDEFA